MQKIIREKFSTNRRRILEKKEWREIEGRINFIPNSFKYTSIVIDRGFIDVAIRRLKQ